mmetsp:Transcript_45531/g.66750  ORF Transcript_45531/g.66750 Transcript_45531/m.66750 type:complete len:91 (+) Transcript_45531:71-343(+)
MCLYVCMYMIQAIGGGCVANVASLERERDTDRDRDRDMEAFGFGGERETTGSVSLNIKVEEDEENPLSSTLSFSRRMDEKHEASRQREKK